MTLDEYKKMRATLCATYTADLLRGAERRGRTMSKRRLEDFEAAFADGLTAMWVELGKRALRVALEVSCAVCTGHQVDPVGYPCSRGVPGEDVQLTAGGIWRCAHHREA